MFELTVIEKHSTGTLGMSHIPCDDDDVEAYVEDLVSNEEGCVQAGILLSYTIISRYEENNQVKFYRQPQGIGVKP